MVQFRSFGFNVVTFLAVILIAFVISNVLMLAKPVVAPSSETTTQAATCRWSTWRVVSDDHGSVNWRIKMSYEYRASNTSGCYKVEIRNVRCSSWTVLAGISNQKCTGWYDGYQLSGNVRTTATACSIGSWGICTDVQLWHKITLHGWYVYREGIY